MIKKEIREFIAKIPPFDLLSEDLMEIAVESISIEFYPRGLKILSQGGTPSSSFNIIKKGGVKVFVVSDESEEITIDYRSEGDSFGFLSLMSGDKSRANVMAVEDTICYIIPKDVLIHLMDSEPLLRDYFMKSFFVNFIDKTYSEMKSRSFTFGSGDKLLYTTPVKELINKEVVTSKSGITVREAASIMSASKISSLVLLDNDGIPSGIVTDRDLRDKVVAKGLDTSLTVDEIMSPPLIRVDINEICFDALLKMIKYNIHHLLVVESGRLKGVVTNHDFMLLQGTSPLSIMKSIENQKSLDGLAPISGRINRIVSMLFNEGVKSGQINRVITELNDRLLQKIIELSIKEIGPSPMPISIIVYGSEGRMEQTFKTLFDLAVVYEDPKTSMHEKEAADHCEKLTAHLKNVFKKSGFPTFHDHPFGSDKPVYGGTTWWHELILGSLLKSDKDVVAAATKFLDMRLIYGNENIITTLRNGLISELRGSNRHLSSLIAHCTKHHSPLGFFKQFVVERSGEHKDKLNLKKTGLTPIVDLIRVLSIGGKISASSTLDRLKELSSRDDDIKAIQGDIASAFEFLQHIRMKDQLMKKEINTQIDDFVDPSSLSLLEKRTLKEVFQIIPRLQDIVSETFGRAGVYA
ncbi:MAG: CBS domain-containing protein [Nitrospirota bacterium]|nr:MAG: CBS domain-containing protein [Nitrospirota bacterium]